MKWAAGIALSVAAVLAASVATAGAGSDPFVSGSTGYDAAASQCGSTPPTAQFAVLNVTGGRPFSANSCLAAEVAAAGSASVSFYFNTGYSGAYGRRVTSDCSSSASAHGFAGKAAQAYAIGCSEARYALGRASGYAPSSWWLDVELANSWSSSSTDLNVATIQGALDAMHAATPAPVGVYSTAWSWQTITGGSSLNGVDASWVVAGNGYRCGGTAFSQSPVWLVQGGIVASGGVQYDSDTAC
jgi:hypothetical protein